MHPEARRDEPLIREIETAKESMRLIAKDPDAVWVPGLEPEHAARGAGSRAQRGGATAGADDADPINECQGGGIWLRVSLLLGVASLVAVALQLAFADALLRLAFPEQEHHAWPLIKDLGAADHVADSLPALLSCAFATALCIQLGVAADSFACFLGVGVAMLGVLSTLGDKVLLLRACPDREPTTECDLPLVLHWICNFVKLAAPPAAVFATSGVWDLLLMAKHLKPREISAAHFFALRTWGWVLATPLLLHVHHIAHTAWHSTPSPKIATAGLAAQLVTWGVLLLARVSKQPRFVVRSFDAKKDD